MKTLLEQFIDFCNENDYKYECGYDWCDCVDFRKFVNVVVNGKTHTLYCLDNGGYRFDKFSVSCMRQIKDLL